MNEDINSIIKSIPSEVKLVAVSKTHSVEEILKVHNYGIYDFGENKVQELIAKYPLLPDDVRWHLIGHLQKNKVKYIAPFVYLIHSVDSLKLLSEVNKEALKNNRVINCLLQIYIAKEETKFGLAFEETEDLLLSDQFHTFQNIRICGLMGMASFTDDSNIVRQEFRNLKQFFDIVKQRYFIDKEYFSILSMGMSSDYRIAIEEGSNMIRLGTVIFGERNYKNL